MLISFTSWPVESLAIPWGTTSDAGTRRDALRSTALTRLIRGTIPKPQVSNEISGTLRFASLYPRHIVLDRHSPEKVEGENDMHLLQSIKRVIP
jgi:hypothetical protein